MTTSTFSQAAPTPSTYAPKLVATLRAAVRETGAGALSLMSAGLNSVDPQQSAHRIAHD